MHFDNPELSINKLHELFAIYFEQKAGNRLSMKHKTYFTFFRHVKEDLNDSCKAQYTLHKMKKKQKRAEEDCAEHTFTQTKCNKLVLLETSSAIREFPDLREPILLSDSAGGKNKNKTISRFCSWLANLYISVLELFPVRGHSFSQCNRHFGLVKSRLKKKTMTTTAKYYLEATVLCRQMPHV
ncbi:hypothetical protein PR048_019017, partial [Dryococelus australis]